MAYDLDRLFEQFGVGRSGFGFQPALRTPFDDDFLGATLSRWAPQVEIDQRGDKLVVRADLPGMKKEDLNIEVDDGVLTISGERKQAQEENRAGFYRSERSYGQFFRSIPLPEGVNADQAEASFNDGVLEVSFPAPKQDQRRGKKIQIQ
jgi:HSP20 family protein